MTPVEALRETLAGEHAAVYVYGVLGGRLSAGTHPREAELLRAAYEVHRARRDWLRSRVAELGGDEVPPAAAYAVEVGSRTPRALLAVAVATEERCAGLYAQLVAATVEQDRRWAAEALTDAAVRGVTLGGPAQSWPGAPELQP